MNNSITDFNSEFLDYDDLPFECDNGNNLYESVTDDLFKGNNLTVKKKKNPKRCQHFKWSTQEDNKLRQLVFVFGDNNWKNLAKNMEGRNSRQCRERWQYYLNPHLKIGNWTKEEDELILQKREELGPKWMTIKKFFMFRTDAMIKNRYNALIKFKQQRKKDLEYLQNLCQNLKQKKIISQKSSQPSAKSQNTILHEDNLKPDQLSLFNCFSPIENNDDDEFFLENDDFSFEMDF